VLFATPASSAISLIVVFFLRLTYFSLRCNAFIIPQLTCLLKEKNNQQHLCNFSGKLEILQKTMSW
jgi:hypothetical protein